MARASHVQLSSPAGADSLERLTEAALVGRLRARRSRLTFQRSTAARFIVRKAHAFTSAMLVEELRPLGVSRSTVYRTVRLLERLELLARVTIDRKAGYVVCDASEHHYHLTCGRCFQVLHLDAAAINLQLDRVAEQQRHFQVRARLIEAAGRCVVCRGGG
jgi:Fe2+ or Zn2+ uptake regulation protein